ncbi:ribosome-associated protein [Legionella sp. PATHC032]|uniref:ribosome biogenesis factor YjgA n=1 Tax=Legionella sp. PATHC032 TaxID=2992039 RepID=UPI001B11E64D|nr:ribosome biogenesis factor YjgA [Legionella sp. PATHC032]MCW8420038.1 ribosome-associated protein [Legionella sp. PATHC032]HAZ7574305.1 ribosome-associated protein [Legionella pneumophila]HBA1635429.1 ribosome-associated protein [Legionella pneumophila]
MDEQISKSQRKRDAHYLQDLGVKFIDLSPFKLDSLPLPDNLRQAIIDARSIKSHGAKRRQAQLIGKLMRAADFEAILAAYEKILEEESSITASFHEIELWRDRLLQDGKEALTEFIDAYQPDDVQQLRQLIKKALDDQMKEKNTGAAKALFRYLRSLIK